MSELPQSASHEPEKVPIELNRRLISTRLGSTTRLMEYYDRNRQARIIAIPRSSDELRQHEILSKTQMPLFSSEYDSEGNCLLYIPAGTRTIRQSLKFISRDIKSYGSIFYQLGQMIRQAHDYGFGMLASSTERTILDGVAFSLDDSVEYGGAIHLVPPYSFDQVTSFERELDALNTELVDSQYFSGEESDRLLEMTRVGYENLL